MIEAVIGTIVIGVDIILLIILGIQGVILKRGQNNE